MMTIEKMVDKARCAMVTLYMWGVADRLILQGQCVVPERTRESTSRMVEVGDEGYQESLTW